MNKVKVPLSLSFASLRAWPEPTSSLRSSTARRAQMPWSLVTGPTSSQTLVFKVLYRPLPPDHTQPPKKHCCPGPADVQAPIDWHRGSLADCLRVAAYAGRVPVPLQWFDSEATAAFHSTQRVLAN
eukprot:1424007-Rhodomonas_salina.1